MKKKTAVLLVDDDENFTNDLCDFLPETNFFYKYSDPREILSTIEKPVIFVPGLKPELSEDFSFTSAHNLYNDVSCFPFDKVVSVIVVDHRMEPINGIELCRAINPRYTKRIMLTSYAAQETAINAFNDGIIDMFLLKSDPDVINKLTNAITHCTEQFFIEISKSIEGYKNKSNPFNSAKLVNEFNQFCRNNKITEYCFIHDFNQLILKDEHGAIKFLSVYTNEDLEDLLLTEQAVTAIPENYEAIRTRKMVPCSIVEASPLIPDGSQWDKIMVPLKMIDNGLFMAHT